MMNEAKYDAENLAFENYGRNTRLGSSDRDIKGSLGQQAVHVLLSNMNVPHRYSKPYEPKQYGDLGDFNIFGQTYDCKCRGTFSGLRYFSFLMGEHERNNKTDNYIITSVDSGMDNVFVLGAISKADLFSKLKEVDADLKFPSAGKFMGRDLVPLTKFIFRG